MAGANRIGGFLDLTSVYRTVGVISSLSALDNQIQIVIYVIKVDRIHVATYLYCPDIGIIRIGLKCVISLPMLSTLLGGPVLIVVTVAVGMRFVSGSGGLLDRNILLFIVSRPKLIK